MFRHFRFLVEGQQFTLLTDQWLLLSGMCCLPSQYSSSSSCLLCAEFMSKIWHTPDAADSDADTLSRPCSLPESTPSSQGSIFWKIPPRGGGGGGNNAR
jgi:hypothetical protein